MGNHLYHYYCLKDNEVWHIVISTRPDVASLFTRKYDIVWSQGPRGGVRLINYNWEKFPDQFRKHGYITQDEKAMQEFTWAKLRAKDQI